MRTVTAQGIEDARTPHQKVLGYILTRGAIGLSMSMHEVCDMIALDKDEDHVYLLCEDDAVLSPHFTEEFTRLLHATKLHDPWWEVIHVGFHAACTTIRSCGRPSCMLGHEAECPVGRPAELFGCYGLALRPSGARALCQRLFPVSLQVDTELSRLYRHLAKEVGSLEARALGRRPADFAPLRAYAPRCPANEVEAARVAWPGPLIVAPSSSPDNTDIQVLSTQNFAKQYKL
ncbi:unnamed protein product [Symbiodinium natans]|uniref:Uncharacterized protein n=1 Tax=Symbiodinium natans TaxID=878477 RepID=A0A812UMN5_9DINO|nr:unnamed protein product [Symbiodinium natans]